MALDINIDLSNVKNMYELTFLVTPELDEAGFKATTKKFEDIIRNGEGEVTNLEHWGKKPLAYQIRNHTHAYYCYLEFTAPGSIVGIVEQEFLYDERILRYLTVKVDKHHAAFNIKRREQGFGKKKEEARN